MASLSLRADGRGPLDFREVDVERHVLPQTYGSARVVVGGGLGRGTEVLCAVTASVGEAVGGACGDVEVLAEWSPATRDREDDRSRQKRGDALTRRLRDALEPWRKGAAPSLHVAAALAWRVAVDVVVLADDGSALEAASIAVRAAVASAELPATEAVAGEDAATAFALAPATAAPLTLDVAKLPVVVAVHVLGGAFAADATADERVDATLSVAVAEDGTLGATDVLFGTFPPGDLAAAIAAAPAIATPLLAAAVAAT